MTDTHLQLDKTWALKLAFKLAIHRLICKKTQLNISKDNLLSTCLQYFGIITVAIVLPIIESTILSTMYVSSYISMCLLNAVIHLVDF